MRDEGFERAFAKVLDGVVELETRTDYSIEAVGRYVEVLYDALVTKSRGGGGGGVGGGFRARWLQNREGGGATREKSWNCRISCATSVLVCMRGTSIEWQIGRASRRERG